MARKIILTESQLNYIIKNSVKKTINEGAGAGYDVEISGLNCADVKILGEEWKGNDQLIKFVAKLVPGQVEWKAQGYYDGVSSEGIYYDQDLVEEIDDEQKRVLGGTVEGYAYWEDARDYAGQNEEDEYQENLNYIQENLRDFTIKKMYGGGWSHVDLTNPIVLEDMPVEDRWGVEKIRITKITIEAPEMVNVINWFFANNYKFDEIYGGEGEE